MVKLHVMECYVLRHGMLRTTSWNVTYYAMECYVLRHGMLRTTPWNLNFHGKKIKFPWRGILNLLTVFF
jgi:hypothetical protein